MGEKEASIKVESTKSDGSDGGPAFEASVTTQTAPTAPTAPPSKTKIEERLKLAVEEAEIDKNRSSDLVPLTQEYDKLKKTLRSLVANAKMYHQHSIIVQKSRDDVSSMCMLYLIVDHIKRLCDSVMFMFASAVIIP
jgi:hypothetical protein